MVRIWPGVSSVVLQIEFEISNIRDRVFPGNFSFLFFKLSSRGCLFKVVTMGKEVGRYSLFNSMIKEDIEILFSRSYLILNFNNNRLFIVVRNSKFRRRISCSSKMRSHKDKTGRIYSIV